MDVAMHPHAGTSWLLLAHDFAKFPPTFRFLITSRREPDIEAAFSRCPNIATKELDIMDDANVSDISSYLHHHLSYFQGLPIFQLASDWPGEEKDRGSDTIICWGYSFGHPQPLIHWTGHSSRPTTWYSFNYTLIPVKLSLHLMHFTQQHFTPVGIGTGKSVPLTFVQCWESLSLQESHCQT